MIYLLKITLSQELNQPINLDSIEGSWKNSQESLVPILINDPTSVADKANNCNMLNYLSVKSEFRYVNTYK